MMTQADVKDEKGDRWGENVIFKDEVAAAAAAGCEDRTKGYDLRNEGGFLKLQKNKEMNFLLEPPEGNSPANILL